MKQFASLSPLGENGISAKPLSTVSTVEDTSRSPPANTPPSFEVHRSNKDVRVSVEAKSSAGDGKSTDVQVVLEPISAEVAATLDAQVSTDEIKIQGSDVRIRIVSQSLALDSTKTVAKYSKKNQRMTITIPSTYK